MARVRPGHVTPNSCFSRVLLRWVLGNTDVTLCFCQFIVHSMGGCTVNDKSFTKLGVNLTNHLFTSAIVTMFSAFLRNSEGSITVFAVTHDHVLVATPVFRFKSFQLTFHNSRNSA